MVCIGTGGFGSAHLRRDGVTVVKKSTNRSVLLHEFHLMTRLRGCEHVPAVHDITSQGLLMDFAGVDLLTRRPDDDASKRAIARQLVEAVVFVHAREIAHRDVKLENVCWDGRRARLIDFGLACHYSNRGAALTNPVGSILYCCPEIAQARPYNGFKADAWSVAVTVYALWQDHLPFESACPDQKTFNVFRAYAETYAAVDRLRLMYSAAHRPMPPDVEAAVNEGLVVEPSRRGEMLTAIAAPALASAPVSGAPMSVSSRGAPPGLIACLAA